MMTRETADGARTPWWTVLGLSMATGVALGFARFAYALILPVMKADLLLNYTDAGTLNTVNSAGYLGATMAAPWVARRFGAKRVFALGMVMTALALIACAFTRNFLLLSSLRFLAGAGGAFSFVIGGGLVAAGHYGRAGKSAALALSIYVGGGGFGILLSALIVPTVLAKSGWQMGWLALGTLATIATLACLPALVASPLPALRPEGGTAWSARPMLVLLISYGFFGAGYIIYMTFIIAFLRQALHVTEWQVEAFWSVLGLAGMISAFAWGPLLARLRGGRGSFATCAISAIGAVLPIVSQSSLAVLASAILFGGAFLAVVASVTSFARRAAPPHAWTSAISQLTVVFGIGQVTGPVLAGYVSDATGGITAGLLMSSVFLAMGALLALRQDEIIAMA